MEVALLYLAGAVSSADACGKWVMRRGSSHARSGRCTPKVDPEGASQRCTPKVDPEGGSPHILPPHSATLPSPLLQPGHYSKVVITIKEKDGGSKLDLVQTGVPEEEKERTEKGWNGLLFDRLKAMLGGSIVR